MKTAPFHRLFLAGFILGTTLTLAPPLAALAQPQPVAGVR